MLLRLAEEKDLKQIAQIYVENWRGTYHGLLPQKYLDELSVEKKQAEWSDYIRTPRQGIFVMEDAGQILGFAAFKPYHRVEDCIYLDSLHVRREWQGKGIGTRLIEKVYQQGIAEKYGRMGVCVVKGNDKARELYVKLGAGHYRDKQDDFTGEITYSEILVWHNLKEK